MATQIVDTSQPYENLPLKMGYGFIFYLWQMECELWWGRHDNIIAISWHETRYDLRILILSYRDRVFVMNFPGLRILEKIKLKSQDFDNYFATICDFALPSSGLIWFHMKYVTCFACYSSLFFQWSPICPYLLWTIGESPSQIWMLTEFYCNHSWICTSPYWPKRAFFFKVESKLNENRKRMLKVALQHHHVIVPNRMSARVFVFLC